MIRGCGPFAPTGSGGMGIPSGFPTIPSTGFCTPGGSPSDARQIGHDVSCSNQDLRQALKPMFPLLDHTE